MKYRVGNWSDPENLRGRPNSYSNQAILCAMIIKIVFGLAYRQTEGFLRSHDDKYWNAGRLHDLRNIGERGIFSNDISPFGLTQQGRRDLETELKPRSEAYKEYQRSKEM